MIISMNRRTLPKAIRTLSDTDLKRMAESDFQATGWKTYEESPYAIYKKQTEGLIKQWEKNL